MTRGRPPSWNPFVDLAPGVWTETVDLTSKDRLSLSSPVRKRAPWLSDVGTEGLLAILEPDGSAELLPWRGTGEALVEGYRERLMDAPDVRRPELALALMDMFMRLPLDPPGRLGLPSNLTAFLNPAAGERIRVVTASGQVWLWGESTWQARRSDRLALIAGMAPNVT